MSQPPPPSQPPSTPPPSPYGPATPPPAGPPSGSFGPATPPPPPSAAWGYGADSGQGPPAGPPTGGFGPPTSPGAHPAPGTPLPAPSPYGGGSIEVRKPRRPGWQWALMGVAGLLALALIGGGTVWMLTGDTADEGGDGGNGAQTAPGEQDPLPTEPVDASLAWQEPIPEVGDGLIQASGTWISGDHLVRLMPQGLVAYALTDGTEVWTVPLEHHEGGCNASVTASQDRVAVLQGLECEFLTVVDIAAGEELFTLRHEASRNSLGGGWDFPAIVGDIVAIGTANGGSGYSITDAKKIWEPRSDDDCRERNYANIDETLVAVMTCGGMLEFDRGSVRATAPSGEDLWEWEFGAEHEGEPFTVESVLSISPLVVATRVGDMTESPVQQIWVIDDAYEEIAHVIDFDPERQVRPCRVNILDDCRGAEVTDGFLYLTGQPSVGGEGNSVVAFDLSTGTALYDVKPISGGYIKPFAVVHGQVLAYQLADSQTEGMVVAIDPETEEATPLMTLDRTQRDVEWAMMSDVIDDDTMLLWHNGAFVMVNERYYTHDEPDTPAALVYR
ncbi:outer membrane protein assembly factor BamB family protein [Streptomyces xiamenensis]